MNRKNDNCPICQQDIDNTQKAVCPICGTPHHRECYLKNGRCANDELHADGFIYEREPSVTYEAESDLPPCRKCGNKLPETALFCPNCSTPVFEQKQSQNFGGQGFGGQQAGFGTFGYQPIFRDPERKIDGFSASDIALYTKDNSNYFTASFERKGLSLNFAALIFGPIYLFYRKMYLHAFILMIIQTVVSIPAILQNLLYLYPEINVDLLPDFAKWILSISDIGFISLLIALIGLGCNILPMFMANNLYKKKVYADIKEISQRYGSDENQRRFFISTRGGTNIFAAIASMVVVVFIYIFLLSLVLNSVPASVLEGVMI